MKTIVGIVLVGVFAFGVTLISAGEGTPSVSVEAPKKEKKFSTPIWHPDAEWEVAGRFLGPPPGCNQSTNLDGPRREILSSDASQPGTWGHVWNSNPCVVSCYDPTTERYHVVAGSARGFMDGPFSRARYGGNDYGARACGTGSPGRRYRYITDPYFGAKLRCFDFLKQEVRTITFPGNTTVRGLTVNKAGHVYIITPPNRLLILNPKGKVEKEMTIELRPDERIRMASWPFSLAFDEKHNRIYASGQYDPKRKWHIWYWDLNAKGAFHGEVAALKTGPNSGCSVYGGAPGSYKDGWYAYPEGGIYWGPDDPERRFLYTTRTDTKLSYRLDLKKKEIWALIGPLRKKKGPIKYVLKGKLRGFQPHTGPRWMKNGDFSMPSGGSKNLGLFLYKRIK